MRTISALLLLLVITAGVTYHVQHKKVMPKVVKVVAPFDRQKLSTHKISLTDFLEGPAGHCSGTAVSPHVILTAGHCVQNDNHIQIDFNVGPATIIAMTSDGHDHVLLLVDETFQYYSDIDQRLLVDGEHVHFWGAPGHNNSVYREGYYYGKEWEEESLKKKDADLFILSVFPGDSGSGIFDENGNIISVTSMSNASSETANFPLSFTDMQLSLIQ